MLRRGTLAALAAGMFLAAAVQAQDGHNRYQPAGNGDNTLTGRLNQLRRSMLGDRQVVSPTPADEPPRVASKPKPPATKFNGGKFGGDGKDNGVQPNGSTARNNQRPAARGEAGGLKDVAPPGGTRSLFEYAAPEGSFSTLDEPGQRTARKPSPRSMPAPRKVTDDETGTSSAGKKSPPPAYREEDAPRASSSRRTAQPDYRLTENEVALPEEPGVPRMPLANAPARAGSGEDAAHDSLDETPTAAGNAPASIGDDAAGLHRPRLSEGASAIRTARRPTPPANSAVKDESAETAESLDDGFQPAKKTAAAAGGEVKDNILLIHRSPAVDVETVGPKKIVVGAESAYKIVVRNRGEAAAREVLLSVVLPSWAEVTLADPTQGEVRLPGGGEAASGLQWSLAELAARGAAELSLRIVPRKNESFELGVQVSQAASESASRVEVQEPKLALVLAGPKEVAFGEKVIYKLTFSNPGTADAQHVVVRLLPIGAADGPMDLHEIGTIRAGENKVVEMELVARQSGNVSIKAEAHADGGLRASLNQEVLVIRADLKLEVEGPKFQYARTVVNYKVRIGNPGNAELRNVQITAQLPSQATYVSSTGGGQSDDEGAHVVWNVRSIAAGGQQEFLLKCQLGATGLNRLQVNAAAGELKNSAMAATEVAALADLALDVTEPAGAFPLGEEVTYELRVKNRGTKTAEAIDVVIYFAQGLDAAGASGHKHELSDGKVQFQSIPSISPGKEVALKVRAKATEAGNHIYRAEAVCESLGSKLGKEGTTRFYSDASAALAAKPEK